MSVIVRIDLGEVHKVWRYDSGTVLKIDRLRQVLGRACGRALWFLTLAFVLIQVVDYSLELDLREFLSFVTAATSNFGRRG